MAMEPEKNESDIGLAIDASESSEYKIYTIGLNSNIKVSSLQNIATESGGLFYQDPSDEDIEELYNNISLEKLHKFDQRICI